MMQNKLNIIKHIELFGLQHEKVQKTKENEKVQKTKENEKGIFANRLVIAMKGIHYNVIDYRMCYK